MANGSGDAKKTATATIVKAAIHPAIGIARIGNSQTDFFYGPEVDSAPAAPVGSYRDSAGALKRQAARFRVYGYDVNGNVVAELDASNAQVTWTVHLANQKGAWYDFDQALDIPESATVSSARRNASVTGQNRASLIIDGGPVTITGTGQSGPGFAFSGQFQGTAVSLGELRTDQDGRLVVLGGQGVSNSPGGVPLVTFANNDGWYDDTSDGPVTASVLMNGVAIPTDPAWIVVAPPNYAPNLVTVRTMYDLVADLFPKHRPMLPIYSFTRDVLPIFKRMSGLQWANKGFANAFGYGAPLDLANPDFIARAAAHLPTPHAHEFEWRLQIANAFRNYGRDGYSPTPWPWMYGDSVSLGNPKTTHDNSALTDTQLAALKQWAIGNIFADYDPSVVPPPTLDAVPLADQPAMLDRAALTYCLADAFHPGCEITWPMRNRSLYMAPFRIRHADPTTQQPDYGPVLTQTIALGPNGPLTAQWPGGLTRWMAVPWQTDTASCLSGYVSDYDPFLPTFWPARVPNQVLDVSQYSIAIDATVPREARIEAFKTRYSWPGVLPGATHEEQVDAMVVFFPYMGIVEERPGVVGDPDLPSVMQVAALPLFPPLGPGPVIPPHHLGAVAALAHAPPQRERPLSHAPSRDGTYMGRFPALRHDPSDR